jgi:hypothetical protein
MGFGIRAIIGFLATITLMAIDTMKGAYMGPTFMEYKPVLENMILMGYIGERDQPTGNNNPDHLETNLG